METGIWELKDNLSRYIRRSRYDELIATGVIRPALEGGDLLEEWPDIRLPPGTAAALIDSDRGEAQRLDEPSDSRAAVRAADLLDAPPQLVTIVTCDARVRDNARGLGYPVEQFAIRPAAHRRSLDHVAIRPPDGPPRVLA